MSDFKITNENKYSIPWTLVVIFILFSAGIIISGAVYFKSQRTRIFREQEENLRAVSILKIYQIAQWHNERLSDASVIRDNVPLIRSISQFLKHKTDSDNGLHQWMNSLTKEYDYSGVLLIDTAFKVRMTAVQSDTVSGEAIHSELQNVLKNKEIIMTDLHESTSVGFVHLDIIIPVINPDNVKVDLLGIIILRVNPGKALFPLIKEWPTGSKSSETLLLRRDGDSVLYLNELRHLKNTALNLKLPLSDTNLLAAKAVIGKSGMVEGVDYRNIKVLGYVSSLPDLPWFMVTKVDMHEISTPLKMYFHIDLAVTILLILINASVFIFWIWNQRVKLYRRQLKNEFSIRELEERFTTAFRMSPVSITISSMSDNKFIDVNETFLKDMEYKREEVIGRTARELDIWADEDERTWLIDEIAKTGRIFGKVISFKSKSGKVIYGLASMSVTTVNGQPCNLSTVVDVTKSIEAEEIIKKQYYTLKGIIESSKGPIFSIDTNYCYTSFNEVHGRVMKTLYGSDIALGKNILDCQTNEYDRGIAKINIDRALSGEHVEEKAWSGSDINNRRYFEVTHNPILNDKNEVVGAAVSARDLTERKRIEEKLKESEELFSKLFHNMLNGFAYCKMIYEVGHPPDFLYINVNEAFESLTGLKNVTGKKASEAIPGIQESDPGLLERYGRVASTGKPEVFEIYVESLKMWFLVSVYSPQKEHFVAVFDVITERKKAENNLKDKIEELEKFNRIMVDREIRMVELKQEINELCGKLKLPPRYKTEEAIGSRQ